MTHTHEPSEPIAAFWFTCKHCGGEIEAVCCVECYGIGMVYDDDDCETDCAACHGTGVGRWEVVK